MDRFIARLNVENFERQLAAARDPATREHLAKLLAEAEEQLRRSVAAHAETPHSEPHFRAPVAGENEVSEAGCRQSISSLRAQLAQERNPSRRAMLERLLAQEEEQLGRMLSKREEAPGDDEVAIQGRISGIVEQLQLEADPLQRASLRRKLIEEEDRFGDVARRIDLADAYIEDGARRVTTMELLIASLSDGDNARRRHLQNIAASREILETFRSYRDALEQRAGRIDL